jgi:hypothetical protein
MLERLSVRALGFMIAASVIVPLAFGYVWLVGSAVVIDETGGVSSAVATDGHGTEQRLHRLWNGFFYAIPNVEGTIEVRCRNGVRKQMGYVTVGMHTKIRVMGDAPCSRVIEDL